MGGGTSRAQIGCSLGPNPKPPKPYILPRDLDPQEKLGISENLEAQGNLMFRV